MAKNLTGSQRGAIHLYCQQLSDALMAQGESVQDVLSKSIERSWTKETVKELLFKYIAKKAFNKDSTEDLEPKEITEIYDTINRFTSNNFGVHVPFPSMETLSEKQR
jgi:hypothetical protein